MNPLSEKPAILYVITNKLNGWKYYGMIHKTGKTIEDRFKDHIKGFRSGRYIHKAIIEHGEENFFITEVERGSFEYIANREKEESKNCLFIKNQGYNANCGKCILFNEEMMQRKIKNTDQEKRVKKWHETYESRRHLHDYTRKEQFFKKQEEVNWSRIRGKTKETCSSLKKQSDSLKKRWKNPTPAMLDNIERMKIALKGQNQHNCERIRKSVATNRANPRFGVRAPNFTGYWITPYGKFATCQEAAAELGIGICTLQVWCNKNKKILKMYHKNNPKILDEWDGKMTWDVGFKKENNKVFLDGGSFE